MTDGDILLRAIIADPDDELARLAYADWLEEYGDERGRFHAAMIRGMWDAEGPARFITTFPNLSMLEAELEHVARRDCARIIDGVMHIQTAFDGCPLIEIVRGFLWRIRCPLSFWTDRGRDLMREHPIRHVETTDLWPSIREYGGGDDRYVLRRNYNRAVIVRGLWAEILRVSGFSEPYHNARMIDHVEYPNTDAEAMQSTLSAAYLAWARGSVAAAPAVS